jgi:hypothetical protein
MPLDQRLASHDSEILTLAENLGALLPTGHAASIATTLWLSVQSLPGVGAALGLLSELAAAPVPLQLIEDVVAGVNGLPPEEARRVVLDEWSSTSGPRRVERSSKPFTGRSGHGQRR